MDVQQWKNRYSGFIYCFSDVIGGVIIAVFIFPLPPPLPPQKNHPKKQNAINFVRSFISYITNLQFRFRFSIRKQPAF